MSPPFIPVYPNVRALLRRWSDFFFDRDRVLAGGIKREGGKRVGTTGRCDLEGEGFPSSKGFPLEQMAGRAYDIEN